ncbi:ABC-type lipoprotein export system ATPase subunit [Streptococcus saliviloxodontae]|uniref:ABC-type lipoprotein export system ATPase subunit n=1 Tax=Streptococcus saliviloxodontae TaxID=1349416 RepID=A0ABS2PKE1_9STRE|nr:ATP-binding cassette domain-containing protein [Streptococcus saliviloxodontae]MBM7635899.1 ABC-type lipoprotein export system ATPase subunit [Streptococcus saliviloxodontae]
MEKRVAVRASRVSKEFRIDNERVNAVLKEVSFEAHYGEFVSILGISGSGKSTLLKCLSSLSLPTSGEVEVNGINPYQLSNSKLAKFRRGDISLIFQSYNLLPALPAIENVTLPLRLSHKKIDRKQIENKLKSC